MRYGLASSCCTTRSRVSSLTATPCRCASLRAARARPTLSGFRGVACRSSRARACCASPLRRSSSLRRRPASTNGTPDSRPPAPRLRRRARPRRAEFARRCTSSSITTVRDAARRGLLRRAEAQADERALVALVRARARSSESAARPTRSPRARRGRAGARGVGGAETSAGSSRRCATVCVRNVWRKRRAAAVVAASSRREGEVDGRRAAALAEELVEGLSQKFRDARRAARRAGAMPCRPRRRRGERGYLAQLLAAPDEDSGGDAREDTPLLWTSSAGIVRLSPSRCHRSALLFRRRLRLESLDAVLAAALGDVERLVGRVDDARRACPARGRRRRCRC